MPLDWTHTGGGGLGSWPSPVDRASHDPVYGLRPRSTERAFSWRPLGPQGEGAIERHSTDYKRSRLHEHGGLRFGRFVCGAGCNTSSCAAQDLTPLNRQAPPLNE